MDCRRRIRALAAVLVTAAVACPCLAQDTCLVIHGRAHKYSDGPLRIWHIGTRHEFQPDESSWQSVEAWIEAGITPFDKRTSATPFSTVDLYADFLICPTEPFRKGAVQTAVVKNATRRHYVRVAGLGRIPRG